MGKGPTFFSKPHKVYAPLKEQVSPKASDKQRGKAGAFNCFGRIIPCRAVSVEPMVPRGNRAEFINSGGFIDLTASQYGHELDHWQEKVVRINQRMAEKSEPDKPHLSPSITDLTLLGSHDSGTYTIKFPKLSKVPGLRYFAKKFEDYSVTQNKTIDGQIKSGVRYLDVRVRSSNTDSGFRIHHGIINGSDCGPELDQLFEFAREHPNEMVVVKIQFDHDKGKSLDKFYEKFLRPNEGLLVKKKGANGHARGLKDIRPGHEQGNIVLMTKDKKDYLPSKYSTCWDYKTSTVTKWANTADTSELKKANRELLERGAEARDGRLLINQMQKTSLTTVHKNKDAKKTLEEQAESVNSELDDWLVAWKRNDKSMQPNIVNLDYVDKYEQGELGFVVIGMNLRPNVDDNLIREEFPENAERIISARKRLIDSEKVSPVVQAKGIAARFKALLDYKSWHLPK